MVRFCAPVFLLAIVAAPALSACGGGASSKAGETRLSSATDAREEPRESQDPADADRAYEDAIDAQADEDYREADDLYERAIEIDPKHRRANQRYVHFLIDLGRLDKALAVAQSFYDNVPGEAISYHTLADAEIAAGRHERAIGTMSGLLAFREDDPTAFEKRGRARLTIGENAQGIRDIRRAVAMEPENPTFLVSLAGGLLRVGKAREARKVLSRALKSDDRSSRANLLLGILSRSEGRVQEALKYHKAAVRLAPHDARAHYELAISYNITGDNAAAEKSFGAAVDADPESGTYWYGYADLLRLMGRNEESAAAYRQSLKLSPKNARAWERLAETLIETDQLARAARQLKRGIGRVDEPRLYFLLGKVYARADKTQRAVEALENYLDAASEDAPDRRAAQKLLQRLR